MQLLFSSLSSSQIRLFELVLYLLASLRGRAFSLEKVYFQLWRQVFDSITLRYAANFE